MADNPRLTERFPVDERHGLVLQIRRAAASAPTNIAEGSRRRRPTDYARFLNTAESSLGEVEYLLIDFAAGKRLWLC